MQVITRVVNLLTRLLISNIHARPRLRIHFLINMWRVVRVPPAMDISLEFIEYFGDLAVVLHMRSSDIKPPPGNELRMYTNPSLTQTMQKLNIPTYRNHGHLACA